MSFRRKIEQEIREHGPIPFSRYMAMCLYDPALGFYSRNAEQFGKAGDFYTSSDVHAVYGRLLARQFEEMWRVLDRPSEIEIVEFGPGRGLFAQDVLDWSEKKFPEFFAAQHYRLVESSPSLRTKLQQTLQRHIEVGKASLGNEADTDPAARASQGRKTPDLATPTIVFANEFFDALPVEIISAEGQLHVDGKDGKFIETFLPPTPEALQYLDQYSVHPEPGERVEASLESLHAMNRICASLRRGFIIAVDYGYSRAEQLEGRHRDTVMTYRQHSASPNPYEAPGEQDITAHVNFTALAATAENNGLQPQPLLTQSQFLMGIGEATQFADAFAECRLPQEHAKVALQLKHLVTPSGMGETFHVLVASKNVDPARVSALSGLSFAKSRL